MAWNSLTGKDDLESLGFTNPVPEITPTIDERELRPVPQEGPDVEGFLKAIEQIESSGGKNFNHATMKSGIHAGDTAMGRFGLMPNTLQELAVRAKRDGSINDEMSQVSEISDPAMLKQHIEANPQVERMFAEQLAKRLLNKFPDEEQAAFSWNQGHNLTPEAVQQRKYKDNDYVKKFQNLRKIFLAGK